MKQNIPSPVNLPPDVAAVLQPIRAILNEITGLSAGDMTLVSTTALPTLAEDATLADVITQVNSLSLRLTNVTAAVNILIQRLNRS